MNNARMWLVVNPTVGIPLFLGAVALTSLTVHASILSHSTWFPAFLQGGQKAKAAALDAPAVKLSESTAVIQGALAAKASLGVNASEALVVLPDGRTARVIFDGPAARSPEITAMIAKPAH